MGQARSDFEKLLYERLVPEFCSAPARRLEPSSFRRESVQVSKFDARLFLAGFHAGLIEHQGRGIYSAAKSNATEQFFWEGPKAASPRPFTLWLEPVITLAALARLHFDLEWPSERIGTQSPDWAFDLVAMLPNQASEHIAGEVKKSSKEVDDLMTLMIEFGPKPNAECPPPSDKRRNAFKKVVALRKRQPPLFWAVGPDADSRAYRVSYRGDVKLSFKRVDDDALKYPLA